MKVGRLLLLNVKEEISFLLKNLSVFEAGRSQGNHVLLKHPSVAMSHFRICRNGEESYIIYDQGAKSGTLVNGEGVEKKYLQEADIIRVGEVELRFDLVDADTPGRLASCAPDLEEVMGRGESAMGSGPDMVTEEVVERPLEMEAGNDHEGSTPCLVVIEGEERGKVFQLLGGKKFVIGRSTSVGIRLCDGTVSREHCTVERVRDHFFVVDHGSSNGTVVNGEPVNKTVLEEGDYIRIGFTILRFESQVLGA